MKAATFIKEKSEMECNYVYIKPEMQSLETRLIRSRPGSETQTSLTQLIHKSVRDIEQAKSAKWIDKIFENNDT